MRITRVRTARSRRRLGEVWSTSISAVVLLDLIFPKRALWWADWRSGRLCSGVHDAHELRLDGVEERLVPGAQAGAERAAHFNHVAHTQRLRAPRNYRDACRPVGERKDCVAGPLGGPLY